MREFFLTSETGFLDDKSLKSLQLIMLKVDKKLTEKLSMSNYGGALNHISIIPSIFPNKFYLENPDHKERKLIKWKSKTADIRLRIDFDKWVESDDKGKEKLFCDNVIRSIQVIQSKVKEGFDAKKLESDIRKELNYEEENS